MLEHSFVPLQNLISAIKTLGFKIFFYADVKICNFLANKVAFP